MPMEVSEENANIFMSFFIVFSRISSIVLCIHENRTVANNEEIIIRSKSESIETNEH